MDSLSNLVKKCLTNGMGFMIESFEYSTNNKSANLYQNSFRYYPDIDKVNCSVKSYFDNKDTKYTNDNDELKSIDEALKRLMFLLEEHCLTFQKLEEFFNSAPANKRKNQQLDLIYDEKGLNRDILEKKLNLVSDASANDLKEFELEKKNFLNSIERMVTNIRRMQIEFQNSYNYDSSDIDDN